ncbi:MAG: glycosyltransferase, partial [Firmicutes bacterium]|nr:glycosyltransferase [Bacillota bacterium]
PLCPLARPETRQHNQFAHKMDQVAPKGKGIAVPRPAYRPTVTVAMTVFNQAPYVSQAVRSVLAQTYRNLELVVVDDGSTDRTARILETISDPRVRVLHFSQNCGKAARMNQILRVARGRYLLEMDGDDWLDRNTVAALVSHMNPLPQSVALLYGNRRFYWQTKMGPRFVRIKRGQPFRGRTSFLRRPSVGGPRFYRVSALRAVKGWPTDYPSRGRLAEDLAVLLRLVQRYQFHHIGRVLYNIRRHGRNTTVRFRPRFGGVVSFLVRRARRQAGMPASFAPPKGRRGSAGRGF